VDSVFQLGAGQVGRGSLYGVQVLHRLAAAGFRIWPFDKIGVPLVVEVFPRLLTGPVTKSRQSERERYLSTLRIPNALSRRAAASDDAFDAAVSAVVMSASVAELLALQNKPIDLIEGRIWQPQLSLRFIAPHSSASRWPKVIQHNSSTGRTWLIACDTIGNSRRGPV
jgi:hypothetical protein